jgi:hypothetical protein
MTNKPKVAAEKTSRAVDFRLHSDQSRFFQGLTWENRLGQHRKDKGWLRISYLAVLQHRRRRPP